MNLLKKIDQTLVLIEKTLIVGLLSVMVGLSFFQVVLRLFFSTSLMWADVFLRHLVLWVGFLGAAVAASLGSHFAIDLVKRILPESLKKPVFLLVNSFTCAGLFYLSGSALKFFKDEISAKSVLFSIHAFEVPQYHL